MANNKETLENFLAIAKMMPEAQILHEIKCNINQYEILKTEDSKFQTVMYMQLFMMKTSIDKDGLLKVMNDVNNLFSMKENIKNANSN